MNRDEAKIILSAYRPDRDDAEDPAFAEAFGWLDRDDELAEWFAESQAFDQDMRAAFASIQPPPGLKETLLAAAKTTPISSSPAFWRRPEFAMAAVLAVMLGVSGLWLGLGLGGASMIAIRKEIPQLTATHHHPFGARGDDMGAIRDWLGAHGGIADFTVPAGLQAAHGVGCEVKSIDGAKVSILCFHLPGNGTAHLYVIDRSELGNPPRDGQPQMLQMGEYAMASWSFGNRSYILAMRGDENSVRALL
ncbi:MAG TPA: hypothetical protein VIM61_11620 [Chthoniobacterales bacterium]|jgi:hypothetical protein